jgi:hypothetical protein
MRRDSAVAAPVTSAAARQERDTVVLTRWGENLRVPCTPSAERRTEGLLWLSVWGDSEKRYWMGAQRAGRTAQLFPCF